jgi:glycosyltransferase involved in cell wall biosynthesis
VTPDPVHVVLPGGVDDPATPSGGNVYDRMVCLALVAAGTDVHEIAVPGAWPRPDAAARDALTRDLAALPDGATVLIDGLVACGVPEVLVPAARRLAITVLAHSPLAAETGLPPAVASDLDARERTTLHAATAVVATSHWSAQRLLHHHALPAHRVHAVPPGTAPAPLAPGTDGATNLLCVAALTPTKGQDLLVAALRSLTDLPWTCQCVGAAPPHPAHPAHPGTTYVGRLRQHDLGARFTLTGPRTGTALDATYAAADLLVVPSRAETYGMAATEALARGIPVLATAVGGLPESVGRAPGLSDSAGRAPGVSASDGCVPGLLVPPGDVTALAVALRRWLTDAELRARLRASARLRRDTLSGWSTTAADLAGILLRHREAA